MNWLLDWKTWLSLPNRSSALFNREALDGGVILIVDDRRKVEVQLRRSRPMFDS